MQSTHYVTASVLGVVTISIGFYFYLRRKQRKEWRQVGRVSSIVVYPVKSCKGIDLTTAQCTTLGIAGDRHIAFADAKNKLVTQRSHPRLTLINQEFKVQRDVVELTAPGMKPLQLSLRSTGTSKEDQNIEFRHFVAVGSAEFISQEADEWISTFLEEQGVRVIRFPHGASPRKVNKDKRYGIYAGPNDEVAFADKCPYLLTSEESLTDLNSRHDGAPFAMSRFRPNIVIDGCEPFQEDRLEYIQIGTAEFRGFDGCGRCPMTTVDPETGIKDDKEPLGTLRKYRLKPEDPRFTTAPVFGRNLGLESPGFISVGNPVFSLE